MYMAVGKIGSRTEHSLLSAAESHHQIWEGLCAKYLPIVPEKSIWRYNRARSLDDPEQGWKIHISATVLSANAVFEKVAPLFRDSGILFKAAVSLDELSRLNCGLFYGFSQVGKFITAYPTSAEMAVSLARRCHARTRQLMAPQVPYDVRFRKDSCVHYRYGGFSPLEVEQPDGTVLPAIRDPDGLLVPDLREPGVAVPAWTSDPFTGRTAKRKVPVQSPLSTTFLSYEALSQRGKGGVYRALDLSVLPARLCVVKEGRRHGETEWDGRDGYWRVKHETQVLKALSSSGIRVPKIYSSFEVGNNFYLVTEYLEGHTLQSSLTSKRKKLPIPTALRYGIQLAELLSKIHAAGWIWRDCKPLNLIVTIDDELRPVDFEGACRISRPDVAPWGTPGYTPPESAGKRFSASNKAGDLYALGACLHQLLTNATRGASFPAPVGRLRHHVPTTLKNLIASLLDPEASSRPDAQHIARTLKAICADAQ